MCGFVYYVYLVLFDVSIHRKCPVQSCRSFPVSPLGHNSINQSRNIGSIHRLWFPSEFSSKFTCFTQWTTSFLLFFFWFFFSKWNACRGNSGLSRCLPWEVTSLNEIEKNESWRDNYLISGYPWSKALGAEHSFQLN